MNALDAALRRAIGQAFPEVSKLELIDYKVRILDQGHGTDAVIRVLIETADDTGSWVTVGVGHNIVEASWRALVDAVTYGLRRAAVQPDLISHSTAPGRGFGQRQAAACGIGWVPVWSTR